MIVYYFRTKTKDAIDNFKLIYDIINLVFESVLVVKTYFLKELVSFVIGIYAIKNIDTIYYWLNYWFFLYLRKIYHS